MVIISSILDDESILIRINCRTNLFYNQDIDEIYNAFRVLLIDSGYYLNSPLNIYLTRDKAFTNDGKYSLDDVTIDDLLETNVNDKKQKNDDYRRDESCYTPGIEKCNTNKKGQDLSLQLDLLIVVKRSTTIADVRRQLEEQLTQQLDILENSTN
ncbi:unnamed protein product, partial [Rotaria sordida]